MEGGRELPVLDGSALGWAMEVQFAGLRLAPEAGALVAAKAAAAQRPEEAAAIMQTKPVTKMVARTEEVRGVAPGAWGPGAASADRWAMGRLCGGGAALLLSGGHWGEGGWAPCHCRRCSLCARARTVAPCIA